MSRKVEILSPAGSYESLKAAIAAGADAVYVGGSRFGARAYANNLNEEQLLEAIDYVHLHGRKIYLTVNTLLKEKELTEELYDYILPYYKQGLDAVIVQDIGVLKFIKEQFPDLPIHASTQMTITNLLGAKFLEQLGVERVVTAREMQLTEIEEITKNTNLEIESFVHGALCYCYSGQCLYSSMLGGRSGNRGQCAQPCRLPYRVQGNKNSQYILSLKDMCTLEYIPQLIEAGIYSFKIEGRMKKPEYVALVTAMYRKYVDLYLKEGKKSFKVDPKDREKLMDLYNRGGSHGGYYYTKNGRDMLSLTRPNHAGVPALTVVKQDGKNVLVKALVSIQKGDIIELPNGEDYTLAEGVKEGKVTSLFVGNNQKLFTGVILNRTRNEKLLADIRNNIMEQKVKERIEGELYLSTTTPARLRLSYRGYEVTVTGEVAQEAVNQPMDRERIEKQMQKTGNTEFEFGLLNIQIEGNLFMPMQSLNELRRQGIQMLEDTILQSYRRDVKKTLPKRIEDETKNTEMPLHVYVEELEHWEEAMRHSKIERIYLDCNALEQIWQNSKLKFVIQSSHEQGKQIYLAMPHVFRSETIETYKKFIPLGFLEDWDGVLVRNYESYMFLKEIAYDKDIVADYNLYQFNQQAKAFWQEHGVETSTAPLELNYHELADLGLEHSELVVYGYYPMMVSAQCIQKTTNGCRKQKGKSTFTDRYQKTFTAKNLCDHCYNIIYNSAPVVLTDQKKEIIELGPKALRMHFTLEDRKTMKEMLDLYEAVFYQDEKTVEPSGEFTRGHFKRGIK